MESSEAFTRVALPAARLFLSRGYSAVSVRAIADELGIKPASLYYHCPGGKAELYARSLETYLGGYRSELSAAKGRAKFPEAIRRMTDWMLEHPPVDLQRIVREDLPHLREADVPALVELLHVAVLEPFRDAFERAVAAEAVKSNLDCGIAAACVVSLVHGLGFLHLPSEREPTAAERRAAKRTVRAGLSLMFDGARRNVV